MRTTMDMGTDIDAFRAECIRLSDAPRIERGDLWRLDAQQKAFWATDKSLWRLSVDIREAWLSGAVEGKRAAFTVGAKP